MGSVIGVIAAVLIMGKSVHQLKTLRIMIIQLQNHQVTSLLLRIRQLTTEMRVVNLLSRVTSRPKTVIVQMKIAHIARKYYNQFYLSLMTLILAFANTGNSQTYKLTTH